MNKNKLIWISMFALLVVSVLPSFVSAGYCDCNVNQCDYSYEYASYQEDGQANCLSCMCVPNTCGDSQITGNENCEIGGIYPMDNCDTTNSNCIYCNSNTCTQTTKFKNSGVNNLFCIAYDANGCAGYCFTELPDMMSNCIPDQYYKKCDLTTGKCSDPCIYDSTALTCTAIPVVCGNNIVQSTTTSPAYSTGTETCDLGILNTNTVCNPMASGGTCTYCDLSCTERKITCGDGIKASTEACDYGSANTDTAPNLPYGAGRTYCTKSCQEAITPMCGDGIVNGPEQCDGTNIPTNTNICASFGMIDTGATKTCDSSCKITGGCRKIDGWYVVSGTWNDAGKLSSTGPSEIQSDPFDIKAGVDYTLSAEIVSGSDAVQQLSGEYEVLSLHGEFVGTIINGILDDAVLDVAVLNAVDGRIELYSGNTYVINGEFTDGEILSGLFRGTIEGTYTPSSGVEIYLSTNCLSGKTLTDSACFLPTKKLIVSGSKTINIPKNDNVTNNIYFKNVKLFIKTSGNADISKISLKETGSADIVYTETPSVAFAGCCPSDYCWNGTVCVNSDLWMDNPSYPPVWNNINIFGFADNHTFEVNKAKATGYRCIITDTKDIANPNDDVANWTPAYIKYDWNYEESGYCAKKTDCFVGYNNYPTSKFKADTSVGCVSNDTLISDNYIINTGNNYCREGNWTTKSYIIASLLQNISKSDFDQRYTLSCYDELNYTYNLFPKEQFDHIGVESACVLTRPQDVSNQIITGVVLTNYPSNPESTADARADFIQEINQSYEYSYGVGTIKLLDCLSGAPTLLSNSEFSKCIIATGKDGDGASVPLEVYYNNKYDYFLISNKIITQLEPQPALVKMWADILKFFKNIFSNPTVVNSYNSLGYATSYDRVYLLRNGTLEVTALEEHKYDEVEKNIVTVLYINYTGTVYDVNPLNKTQLDSILDAIADVDGKVILSTTYLPNENTAQELIIKSSAKDANGNDLDARTGIWPYLTTMLRIDGHTLK